MYISTWVSFVDYNFFAQRQYPILLSPLPHITAIWKRQNPTVQLHHQPLFSSHRNWMSATELSRILMRVVSESKLLTWGVGTERRPRSGGVECSQTPSATIRVEMSEFITSGLACPQSVRADSKPHSCLICLIMGIFWGDDEGEHKDFVTLQSLQHEWDVFHYVSLTGDMSFFFYTSWKAYCSFQGTYYLSHWHNATSGCRCACVSDL